MDINIQNNENILIDSDNSSINKHDTKIKYIEDQILENLHKVLFGDHPNAQDVKNQKSQCFEFVKLKEPIFWGLKQLYGGPCGILAPIQAYLLHDLLFSEHKIENVDLLVKNFNESGTFCMSNNSKNRGNDFLTHQHLFASLSRVLADIVIRATPNSHEKTIFTVLTLENSNKFDEKNSEKITSSLLNYKYILNTVNGKNELRKQFYDNIEMFCFIHDDKISNKNNIRSQKCRSSVLLFLFCVILNRGIETIYSDFDDLQPLVQKFGHCSQELVNLMICGKAFTNVFDGNKLLGDTEEQNSQAGVYYLKGIDKQYEIGFLTVLEAMRYSKVGNFYKTPKWPIWVVGSSSHYTVLLGLDQNIVKISNEEKHCQYLKKIFQQFDQHESGFIKFDQLTQLLSKIDLLDTKLVLNEMQRILANDTEIILFSNFYNAVLHCEKKYSDQSCSSCTYLNKQNLSVCEMCFTQRNFALSQNQNVPLNNSVQSKPKFIKLFHYNGLDNMNNRYPEVRQIYVWPDQDYNINSENEGLIEVINTKQHHSLVEFPGNFSYNPRI